MSLDNFLVRPQRRYVEKYARRRPGRSSMRDAAARAGRACRRAAVEPSWTTISPPSSSTFWFSGPSSRCFGSITAFDGLSARIIEIASLLEELANVPMVAAEMALIQEVQTDEFWQDITLPMLETVRRRLRALVKLIEYKQRTMVYSDFEDSIGAAADIDVPGISVGTDMDASAARRGSF